jgi:hypothetical protein
VGGRELAACKQDGEGAGGESVGEHGADDFFLRVAIVVLCDPALKMPAGWASLIWFLVLGSVEVTCVDQAVVVCLSSTGWER